MAENFGVGGRGTFYEEAGAIRDVVQNHLMQIVTLIAMERPRDSSVDAMFEEKIRLFTKIPALTPADVVRGQFRGYRQEPGVAADSTVETFAAARLTIDTPRWQGVPFFLRAGKTLPVTAVEIMITLKGKPFLRQAEHDSEHRNYLRIRLSPELLFAFGICVKVPGEALVGQDIEVRGAVPPAGPDAAVPAHPRRRAAGGDDGLRPREGGRGDVAHHGPDPGRCDTGARVRTGHLGARGGRPAHRGVRRLAQPGRGTTPRGGHAMNGNTERLRQIGQSLWLDNITRQMLNDGTLQHYIDELAVTGLTSNPSIYNNAIKNSDSYDGAIAQKVQQGLAGEDLFFELAIEDLRRAADQFRPVFDRTCGVDGWVSLEVSPVLAYDTASTLAAARKLHAAAERPNLFIKIPGTREGLPAIEEAIFAGVPINVTLLFSREHYLAAAEAYLRGIERRLAAGLRPDVGSVASLFVSRWDTAAADRVPEELKNRLGIAIGKQCYKAYCAAMTNPRWQRVFNAGARPQRLLMASTGTKDPQASDTLYIEALAAPFTVDTIPEGTLKAVADHGEFGAAVPPDGGDCDTVLAQFAAAGVDIDALAAQLQSDGAASFVKSWKELMAVIASKSAALK